MKRVVLDASALLAAMQAEPGAAIVAQYLDGSAMRAVNLSEVVTALARRGVSTAKIAAALGPLHLDVRPFELSDAHSCGELAWGKASSGLSLGDPSTWRWLSWGRSSSRRPRARTCRRPRAWPPRCRVSGHNFVFPFLAPALGTLTGALVAYLVAASLKLGIAHFVGAFFLAGGIAASFMIPARAWFIALDLLAAYVPMAWLGTRIGERLGRLPSPPGAS